MGGDLRGIATDKLGEHVWRVTAPGERDLADAPVLREVLGRIYADGSSIVLDLSDTIFVDSSMIGEIVSAAERSRPTEAHGLVVVAPPGNHPRRIMDMVRLDVVVTVVDDLQAALDSIG